MESPPEDSADNRASQSPEKTKSVKEKFARITPAQAADNFRGSVPQRVINILVAARKEIAEGRANALNEKVLAEAAEAELKRQGIAVPAEESTPPKKKRTKKEALAREEGLCPQTYADSAKKRNSR